MESIKNNDLKEIMGGNTISLLIDTDNSDNNNEHTVSATFNDNAYGNVTSALTRVQGTPGSDQNAIQS